MCGLLFRTLLSISQWKLNLRSGNMMFITAVALLCLSSFSNGFPTTDCGSKVGNFSTVTISDCDPSANTCILHKGKNATIEIEFTIHEDATDLKSVVHGKILDVLVPFPLPHPNACDDPESGVTCPLRNGASFHYKATLPVRRNYPPLSVTVRWELQDQNKNDVVCLELPVRIQ